MNYSTGGWVAAPAVGNVVQRMAPLLGMAPERRVVEEKDVPTFIGKKRVASLKKTIIKAKAGTRTHKVSGAGENHMLKKVRAVLGAPERNRGTEDDGPQEQALATY